MIDLADPGVAAVFLHGWLMSPAMWDDQVRALAGTVRTVALAQPGHGIPGPGDGFTIADWSDWLIGELDREGVQRAVLAGHSMGGMLVLETYRRHPGRVAGLIFVSTTDEPWPPEHQQGFLASARMCADAWGPALAAPMAERLLSSAFLAANPGWLPAWERTVATYDREGMAHLGAAFARRDDQTAIAKSITVPALVIHGPEDGAVPFAQGERLAGRIPGAAFVAIPGCGHAPPMEQPGATTAAILGFVRSLATR